MPFLDKDKLNVTLVLQKDNVMAGETLTGNMNIAVIEKVKCTALRVHVVGEELMYRRKQQQNRGGPGGLSNNQVSNFADGPHINNQSRVETSTHKIVELITTVLGEQSGRGGRGNIELDPGNYSYPFSLVLPQDLPPTYSVREFHFGGYVAYKVKAVVDIPMGFDNELSWPLTLYRAAPLSQVYEARATPAVLPTAQSGIATCGCSGCYCRHEAESYIATTAMVAPVVAVVKRGATAPFQPTTAAPPPLPASKSVDGAGGAVAQPPINVSGDPSIITLRVIVENHTASTSIASARVRLTQYVKYRNGYELPIRLVDRTIAFDRGVLSPGESTAFDCPMSISDGNSNSAYVLPTFAAHFAKVRTTLEVDYPNVKADDTLSVTDFIKLVSAIDTTNTVPPV